MRTLAAFIILGSVLLLGGMGTQAASPGSDWPALNADAAQSNANAAEHTLTARNVLKLKVRWAVPNALESYPIVYGGRAYVPIRQGRKVHVHVIDVTTGRSLALYAKDALGGMLVAGGKLYLAGHTLQALDVSSGQRLAYIHGPVSGIPTTFVDPQSDGKTIYSGFANGIHSSIFTVDPNTSKLLRTMPSTSAFGAGYGGRIVTAVRGGSAFYDEASGHMLAHPHYLGTYWFASDPLALTVISSARQGSVLTALDGTGHVIWRRHVGPYLATAGSDWPHAVGPNAIYVQTWKPHPGILALDPLSGKVLWSRSVLNTQRIVLANDLLYDLTYSLGQPVRLVTLHAGNGAGVGTISLSVGTSYFNTYNGLMVADGTVFIRAETPSPELLALAP